MADIAMQIEIQAPAEQAYQALTTTDGVASWWTTRNETRGEVGEVDRFWFPDAPISWDMRVEQAEPSKQLVWRCVGGPPEWVGTTVRWRLQRSDSVTVVLFDHEGFAAVDTMFRIVTLGWAQMILQMKQYLESGEPAPFFVL